MKIYLDTCCLSRQFNDQAQIRIRRETEAVEEIFDAFIDDRWTWIISEALTYEVNNNPNWIQRDRMKSQMDIANENVSMGVIEKVRSNELEALGFKHLDAWHLACAESGNVDVFLTTDDRLLRRAHRIRSELRVRVENPYEWLQETTADEHSRDDR